MTDYRSPAATHSTYAKEDPTAQVPVSTSNVAYAGHPVNNVRVSDGSSTSNLTNEDAAAAHTHHPHHHHHGHSHHHPQSHSTSTQSTGTDPNAPMMGRTGAEETAGNDRVVKTGDYVTGLEPAAAALGPTPVPVVGDSYQHRITGAPTPVGPIMPANAGPLHSTTTSATGGLPAVAGQSGPLGGGVVLGGQCECLRNGGTCSHGIGQCNCRGCSTGATTVNPGLNVGVADTVNHTARQAPNARQ